MTAANSSCKSGSRGRPAARGRGKGKGGVGCGWEGGSSEGRFVLKQTTSAPAKEVACSFRNGASRRPDRECEGSTEGVSRQETETDDRTRQRRVLSRSSPAARKPIAKYK